MDGSFEFWDEKEVEIAEREPSILLAGGREAEWDRDGRGEG